MTKSDSWAAAFHDLMNTSQLYEVEDGFCRNTATVYVA